MPCWCYRIGLGQNWYLNTDNFESYGWAITLAGVAEMIAPCPSAVNWYGLPNVQVDVLVVIFRMRANSR